MEKAADGARLARRSSAASRSGSSPRHRPYPPRPSSAGYQPNLANGETIFTAGGCVSCHKTPGSADRLELGGGLGLVSPFGTFYAPNISPDRDHGIGQWSELTFVNALLRGVGKDGEHLYPALPYTSYHNISVADARDVFAYIGTLPGVEEPSRRHDVPFPFSIRRALGGWKFLFFDDKPFTPDPSKSPQWNRGAYLVEGPGHCAECHSPRNVLGAIKPAERFAGGPEPEGKGWVPNITPHADGISAWSEADIAEFLKSGLTPIQFSGGQDGRGDRQHQPPERCRPRGRGELSRLPAAAARQGSAESAVTLRYGGLEQRRLPCQDGAEAGLSRDLW